MNIEYEKTYNFHIDDIKFGELDKEALVEVFKDGRVASHFLERHLPIWFPSLVHVAGCKDHDHIDADGKKYDAKNFTRAGGLKFMPSNMLGTGRKYNYRECREKIMKLDLRYIACDIVDFPQVRVKFFKGEDLLKRYPKGSVSKSNRNRKVLFG